jgi:hypothetical protein
LILCAIICLLLRSPGSAQVCGNVDGDAGGTVDISDLDAFFIDFWITQMPMGGQAELDSYSDVTISDYMALKQWLGCYVHNIPPTGCLPPIDTPLNPGPMPGAIMCVSDSIYPPGLTGGLPVTIGISTADPLFVATLSFRFLVNGVPAAVLPGSIISYDDARARITTRSDGINVMMTVEEKSWCDPLPTGYRRLAQMKVEAGLLADSVPLLVEQIIYPTPVNPVSNMPVHRSIMVFSRFYLEGASSASGFPIVAAKPGIVYGLPCCVDTTGNVDCDNDNLRDISDLSVLIDHLYLSFVPLCCKKAANCDGSLDGNVDISDLSALIDYLYISFTPTANCL